MRTRNSLFASIRNLRESRNNWRRKYKVLLDENRLLKARLNTKTIEVNELEAENKQLKMEQSKINGWKVFEEKYQ